MPSNLISRALGHTLQIFRDYKECVSELATAEPEA